MGMLKKYRISGVAAGVILLILGIFFLAEPVKVEIILNWILGICLLAGGIAMIAVGFIKRKENSGYTVSIGAGAGLVILAAFILTYEGLSIFAIGIVIGIVAVFMAFDRFAAASGRRKEGLPYGGLVGFGIIQLLFGAFMFYATFAILTAMIMIMGIYLIFTGIMFAVSSLMFPGIKKEK